MKRFGILLFILLFVIATLWFTRNEYIRTTEHIPSSKIDRIKNPILYEMAVISELVDAKVNADCSDFTEQGDAQLFLDFSIDRFGDDFAHLDGDSNGTACESLPY